MIEGLNHRVVEIQSLLTDIYEIKLSMDSIFVLLKNTAAEIGNKLSAAPDMKSISTVYANLIERSIKTYETYKTIEDVSASIRDSVKKHSH